MAVPVAAKAGNNAEPGKPRKTGSVALFFRKFYNLAAIRMTDLCESLEITEIDLKKKIWTIFEYSIKDRTELMKDRHLDQILMCAIYVICKLAKMEKNSFTEIMKYYRNQPQAESHIYRSVLIAKRPTRGDGEDDRMDTSDDYANSNGNNQENHLAPPPTPTSMAGTSQNFGDEERGDLIKFYNTVYVPQVKEVANKFGFARSSLALSPLPKSKQIPTTPFRRVTSSVITRTLNPKSMPASPAPELRYCFSRSPAKVSTGIKNKKIIVKDFLLLLEFY